MVKSFPLQYWSSLMNAGSTFWIEHLESYVNSGASSFARSMPQHCAKNFSPFSGTSRKKEENKITNNRDNLSFLFFLFCSLTTTSRPSNSTRHRHTTTKRFEPQRNSLSLSRSFYVHNYQSVKSSQVKPLSFLCPNAARSFSMSQSVIDIGRAGIFFIYRFCYITIFPLFLAVVFVYFVFKCLAKSFTVKVKSSAVKSNKYHKRKCAFSTAIICLCQRRACEESIICLPRRIAFVHELRWKRLTLKQRARYPPRVQWNLLSKHCKAEKKLRRSSHCYALHLHSLLLSAIIT